MKDRGSLALALEAVAGVTVERDRPLGELTTYRIGGSAALTVSVGELTALVEVGRILAAADVATVVLGRGSNVLVADTGFNGVVLRLVGDFEAIAIPSVVDARVIEVTAGSAAPLPVVARRTAAAGLGGFEWAVGVPGTIGGAVRMNAGGHGSDMATSIARATILRLGGASRRVEVADLGFGFRSSGIAPEDVVLDATLVLRPREAEQAEAEIDEIVRWRREHQPGGQNCGSVFVNPVPGEISAGALIDGLGLRGLRDGTAAVSEKHANFILSEPGGAASDVVRLMSRIRAEVLDRTGHDLRSEVRLLGFDVEVAAAAGARPATSAGH
ncbi:MAG: UDP-N-acetylmuramate dehydrogenase [Ilumatobacteraceae bacterium]